MAESNEDMLSRVEQMSVDDGGTWDLSPNDQAALAYVVKRIATLEAALRPFAEDGRDVCDPGRDDGADTAIVLVSALRAAMEAMEGRDG